MFEHNSGGLHYLFDLHQILHYFLDSQSLQLTQVFLGHFLHASDQNRQKRVQVLPLWLHALVNIFDDRFEELLRLDLNRIDEVFLMIVNTQKLVCRNMAHLNSIALFHPGKICFQVPGNMFSIDRRLSAVTNVQAIKLVLSTLRTVPQDDDFRVLFGMVGELVNGVDNRLLVWVSHVFAQILGRTLASHDRRVRGIVGVPA